MRRPLVAILLPFEASADPITWTGGRSLSAWAGAVEAAGFEGVALTDHPFPSDAWLPTGHHALDPFVALTAFACATTRLRLITDILVAGYRNPYLVAKSIATLDVVSGGRLTVGMAAGYQRDEFAALGASFTDRGRRFDAAIAAMTAALGGGSVAVEDGPFPAPGNTMRPLPVQRPRPPLWIGGNAPAAIDRAIELGDGWIPFPQPPARVAVSGAPALTSLTELAPMVADAQARRAASGAPPLTICCGSFERRIAPDDLGSTLEAYADAGVDWITLLAPGATMDESVDRLDVLGSALR